MLSHRFRFNTLRLVLLVFIFVKAAQTQNNSKSQQVSKSMETSWNSFVRMLLNSVGIT